MRKTTVPPTDGGATEPPVTPPIAPEAPGGAGDAGDKPRANQGGQRFFSWIRSLGIVRQPGWIGGVAVAIADRIGIDVLIVRGILIVAAILGAPAFLLYAAAWLLLPDTRGRIQLEEMLHGRFEPPLVGIAILVALSVLPVAPSIWSLGSSYWGQPYWAGSVGRAIWTLIVIGLVVAFIVWMSRRSNPVPPAPPTASEPNAATPLDSVEPDAPAAPAAPATDDQVADWRERQAQWKTNHEAYRRQHSAERQAANQAAASAARAERMARASVEREQRVLTRSNPLYSVSAVGLAFVAGAVTSLVTGAGAPGPVDFLAGGAVAVGVLGLAIVINGAMGRRSGGASAIAVLLLIPLIFASIFPQTSTLRYSGDRDLVLHSAGQGSSRTYTQLSGDVTIDLSNYYRSPRPSNAADFTAEEVRIFDGSGHVTVILPSDEYENLSATTLSGTITTPTGHHVESGRVNGYSTAIDPDGNNNPGLNTAARMLDVQVFVGNGNVTFSKGAN
jgi:phage shock protein PspC (stress-responsive transcriptional regulator)